VNVNRKRIPEVPEATPKVRKDKIAELKKAITEGSYKVKSDHIAGKILRELIFELALNLNNHEDREYKNN
jgi:anti-sigma28 factor (negative regulator of flagellin synthesis)